MIPNDDQWAKLNALLCEHVRGWTRRPARPQHHVKEHFFTPRVVVDGIAFEQRAPVPSHQDDPVACFGPSGLLEGMRNQSKDVQELFEDWFVSRQIGPLGVTPGAIAAAACQTVPFQGVWGSSIWEQVMGPGEHT